jgi:hypothetical protein|tara:strand:- start:477 stop:695 length:219 start_codon:yes stop_codon:yes gene_type:complete
MKNKKTKILAQMKSSHYYIFWGACTVAVVLGQLYVGTGYRVLHGGVQELLNKVDGVLLHKSDSPMGPYDGFL